jgi:hypothetical protein
MMTSHWRYSYRNWPSKRCPKVDDVTMTSGLTSSTTGHQLRVRARLRDGARKHCPGVDCPGRPLQGVPGAAVKGERIRDPGMWLCFCSSLFLLFLTVFKCVRRSDASKTVAQHSGCFRPRVSEHGKSTARSMAVEPWPAGKNSHKPARLSHQLRFRAWCLSPIM